MEILRRLMPVVHPPDGSGQISPFVDRTQNDRGPAIFQSLVNLLKERKKPFSLDGVQLVRTRAVSNRIDTSVDSVIKQHPM